MDHQANVTMLKLRYTSSNQWKGKEEMVMYYKGKRIGSNVYTKGKYGKRNHWPTDTDNPYLYSYGRYPTKLQQEDLPECFVPIRSRVIHYMDGYVRTCGITDMKYTWVKLNHLFKDDYIYVSYHGKLSEKITEWGYVSVGDYDVCVCGNDIVDIVVAAEKYSGFDTAEVRTEIEKKRVWLRDHEPEYYARAVGEDKDIFEIFREKGFIK